MRTSPLRLLRWRARVGVAVCAPPDDACSSYHPTPSSYGCDLVFSVWNEIALSPLQFITAACLGVVLTACSSLKFEASIGPPEEQCESGGTCTVVDDMEVWTWGGPPRRFAVLGTIDDERILSAVPTPQTRAYVVSTARSVGGDAVIEDRMYGCQMSGADGRSHCRVSTSYRVIKYVHPKSVEINKSPRLH